MFIKKPVYRLVVGDEKSEIREVGHLTFSNDDDAFNLVVKAEGETGLGGLYIIREDEWANEGRPALSTVTCYITTLLLFKKSVRAAKELVPGR